jgi:RecQ family ATP-dependent DNA helicase
MKWTIKAEKLLKKHWNIENLKDEQFEVINNLLLGNDVIGLLPTGYGKSMTFILPPLLVKKIILIISPLISLMEDQKEKLDSKGIPCCALHSNNVNKLEDIENILLGNIKIVFMSPEYLVSNGLELADKLYEKGILGFLAIDEAHCISSWGHDFRPEYKQINIFRNKYNDIPILALTATATNKVKDDIISSLELNNAVVIRASFDRPNLYLEITEIPKEDKIVFKNKKSTIKTVQVDKTELVIPFIKKYSDEKIIIYVNSRDDTLELSTELNKIYPNISEGYHAGLSKKKRNTIQSDFINGTIKVIICTIAFGMGIDQKIRVVIIFGCPSSIEEYYQQIGRCGRDGQQCETVLYFDYKNFFIAEWMLKDIKLKFPALYQSKIRNLNNMKYLIQEKNTCRRKYILNYFNETYKINNCKNCDNCLKNYNKESIIEIKDNDFDSKIKDFEKLI